MLLKGTHQTHKIDQIYNKDNNMSIRPGISMINKEYLMDMKVEIIYHQLINKKTLTSRHV